MLMKWIPSLSSTSVFLSSSQCRLQPFISTLRFTTAFFIASTLSVLCHHPPPRGSLWVACLRCPCCNPPPTRPLPRLRGGPLYSESPDRHVFSVHTGRALFTQSGLGLCSSLSDEMLLSNLTLFTNKTTHVITWETKDSRGNTRSKNKSVVI